MAEKITIAELDINTEAVATQSGELAAKIAELRQQMSNLKESTNGLSDANDEQLKSYAKTDAQLKKLNTEYNHQKNILAELETGTKGLNDALEEENKTIRAAQKNNSELVKMRSQVNAKTKEGQKAITQINAKIDQNNKFIKDNVSQLEKQRLNIGNYASALDKLIPGIGGFINGLKGSASAVRASTVSLKAFRMALISTGIGAIVVALGSLVAAFASTQKGMDMVTKATDAMGAVLDVVIRRLVEFGEGLIEFFSGEFASGVDKMGKAFKGAGEEIVGMVKASSDLSDATVKLEEDQNKFVITNAKLRAEMKEYNKQAEDVNNALEDRIKFSKEAERVEEERAKMAMALAEEELRIAQARDAQGDSTREELRQTAELEAELFRIREENAERLTTQVNRTNTLIAQQAKEIEALSVLEAEVFTEKLTTQDTLRGEALAKELEDITAQSMKRLQIRLDTIEKEQQAEAEAAEQRKRIAFLELQTRLAMRANVLGQVAKLFGEETAIGKAAAIAQATMHTYAGAAAALAPPPTGAGPLFGPILAGTTIAFGLAQVSKILGLEFPRFAKGTKRIRGAGTETSDDVPAMLSKNERVVDARNNRKIGFDLSNDQLATAAQLYRSVRLHGGFGDQGIIEAIDRNTKVLRNKTVPHTSVHVSEGYKVVNQQKYLR